MPLPYLIGIFTSLFSAIFITRLFISAQIKEKLKLIFLHWIEQKLVHQKQLPNLLQKEKSDILFQVLIILAGIISLSTRGLNKGVEFVGGRSYIVNYTQPVNTLEIANVLATKFVDANGDKSTPEVKTFGATSQVKITTKYKVNEVSSLGGR